MQPEEKIYYYNLNFATKLTRKELEQKIKEVNEMQIAFYALKSGKVNTFK